MAKTTTIPDRVHSAYSQRPLEMRGAFVASGPQAFGGNGAPEWVRDFLAAHPEVESIGINTKERGEVFSRIES